MSQDVMQITPLREKVASLLGLAASYDYTGVTPRLCIKRCLI